MGVSTVPLSAFRCRSYDPWDSINKALDTSKERIERYSEYLALQDHQRTAAILKKRKEFQREQELARQKIRELHAARHEQEQQEIAAAYEEAKSELAVLTLRRIAPLQITVRRWTFDVIWPS